MKIRNIPIISKIIIMYNNNKKLKSKDLNQQANIRHSNNKLSNIKLNNKMILMKIKLKFKKKKLKNT